MGCITPVSSAGGTESPALDLDRGVAVEGAAAAGADSVIDVGAASGSGAAGSVFCPQAASIRAAAPDSIKMDVFMGFLRLERKPAVPRPVPTD